MRRAILFSVVLLAACSAPPRDERALGTVGLLPSTREVLVEAGIDPSRIRGNARNVYSPTISADTKRTAGELLTALGPYLRELKEDEQKRARSIVEKSLLWAMVRTALVGDDNNNVAAVPLEGMTWTDAEGKVHPVVLFRSGFTPAPDAEGSCYRSILEAGRVRHVVNLYDGDMFVKDLEEGEAAAARRAGATYVRTADLDYGPWRYALRDHVRRDAPERAAAMKALGKLIKEQILLPGGAPPRGNILVHCGGGMHRTGMVVGILQKAVNKTPLAEVERAYRYHVGWLDEKHPGGAEESNLELIRDFPEAFLK